MTEDNVQLNNLIDRLNTISRKQEDFAKEINGLRDEIRKITIKVKPAESQQQVNDPSPGSVIKTEDEIEQIIPAKPPFQYYQPTLSNRRPAIGSKEEAKNSTLSNRNLEKLIGENLISKIGIVILILGVAIGTKYAIEHELISPLTRIIMGYLVGLGLFGFAVKLKKNYDNFSAVLLSGAMAILYFITFAAYNFFGIIPQIPAFILMVIFTVFTVLASLNYNKPVIAHIGLVGAYAVPFLLSDGSGKVVVLFTYMAIINIGILALAFRKYWKSLNYVAFALTWIIFVSWYNTSYLVNSHFVIASLFLFVFFISFYSTFLAYKLTQKEKFDLTDVVLILANSFIFYGSGYAILHNYQTGSQLLGLFTLFNALLHFGVSVIIYKQKLADRNLFFMVSGLVLVFIAIAIPVQLNGNWVTLLWAGEAALLFWIGRTKKVHVYEALSYVLMALSFFSMFHDWIVSNNYLTGHPISTELPFINVQFLSSVMFIAAFGFILFLNSNSKYPSALVLKKEMIESVSAFITFVLLLTIYLTFFNEIASGFDQDYLNSVLSKSREGYIIHNESIIIFKTCWLINYSLLFSSILCYINFRWIKSNSFEKPTIVLSFIFIFIFLTVGLFYLSYLRESYLQPLTHSDYSTSLYSLSIRYSSYIFVAITFIANSLYLKGNSVNSHFKNSFPLLLHTAILWILSSELINWMDITGSSDSYKLGITILWGVYSLAMIVLGIWRKNKNLRIGAIVLFGVTLTKLFLYDLSSLNTISKTIVMVSLGILLLIISFLYNKYKQTIFDEREDQ
jgi:uncharacterized membrane protein